MSSTVRRVFTAAHRLQDDYKLTIHNMNVKTGDDMKIWILKAIFTATALTACADPSMNEPDTNSFKAAGQTTEKPITFKDMQGNEAAAYSGSFFVPENRNDPNSRKIKLEYIRFLATTDTPGAPIVYLAGGPGGSGINTAKGPRFRLFMSMRQFGDVIAFDQRGTGASSNDLKLCKSGVIVTDKRSVSDSEYGKMYKKAADICLKFWAAENIDILGYTTQESVDDLDALRLHLGADKISLWGISYGSHLSLAALKTMEDRIDRVVLASVEGLDQTVKFPAETDKYFSRVQEALNSVPGLKEAYPDIVPMMRRVQTRLETNPMQMIVNFEDTGPYNYVLDKNDLQMMTTGMIADPKWVLVLLEIYAGLDKDDTGPLLDLLSQYFSPDEDISFSPMTFAMDIASGITDARLAQVNHEAKNGLGGTHLNFPMPLLNKYVAGLDLGDSFRRKPTSKVPTLVLTGTLDGRTYVESQAIAVSDMPNVERVLIRNAGHNLFMVSPDVTSRIEAFMRGEKSDVTEITVPFPPATE